jgi:hypothetical protein
MVFIASGTTVPATPAYLKGEGPGQIDTNCCPIVPIRCILLWLNLGGSDYEREASSSSDGSSGSREIQPPSTNQGRVPRRVPNHHRVNQRETGGNRGSRERHDSRGGTGPRRRSRAGETRSLKKRGSLELSASFLTYMMHCCTLKVEHRADRQGTSPFHSHPYVLSSARFYRRG